MKASDIMTVGVATVRPEQTVTEAARLMLSHHVSGLPVVDSEGSLLGIVTEGDFLRRTELGTERQRPRWLEFFILPGSLANEYVRAHGRRVEEVMTRDVVTVGGDSDLSEIVSLMERHKVKRLPVVRDAQMVGIVSRANLLGALAREAEQASTAVADDMAVRQHILDEIDKGWWASSRAINVTVRDGVVELSGAVTDDRVREALRVAAENAPGARQVVDNLQVIVVQPAIV
jgi:CBS domain-containing protein